MSNAGIEIAITGRQDSAAAAIDGVVAKQGQLTDAIKKTSTTSKRATKEDVAGLKEADKIRKIQIRTADSLVRKNQTLEETFKRELRTLVVARRQQGDATGKYTETIERLKTKYRETAAAASEAGQAELQARQDADTKLKEQIRTAQNLVNAHKSLKTAYNQEVAALQTARAKGKISNQEFAATLDAVKRKFKEQEEAQNNAVGSKALDSVKALAVGYLSLRSAINFGREALEFFNAERERGSGETTSLLESRRSLRQISKGDFDLLESRADTLATDPTLGIDRVAARKLIFDARSTGFEGEERTVAAADPVIAIRDGAAFAGEFRKFFAGDKLSIEAAFNTALAGAAESQFNITELLPQIRKAAQGALAGGESSDVVASTSVLASNFGQSTGDRLRALGVKLATDERTQGLDLIESVQKLIADPELADDIIKDSSELKAAFAKFSERLEEIQLADKRIEQAQRAAPGEGLLGKAVSEARSSSTEQALRASIAAEAKRGVSAEIRFSEKELSNRAVIDREVAGGAGFVFTKSLQTAKGLGADLDSPTGNLFRNVARVILPGLFGKEIKDEATKQTELLKNINNNLGKRNNAPAVGVD